MEPRPANLSVSKAAAPFGAILRPFDPSSAVGILLSVGGNDGRRTPAALLHSGKFARARRVMGLKIVAHISELTLAGRLRPA